MVELTAKFQFIHHSGPSGVGHIHFIFDSVHIGFLKPIYEQKLGFYAFETVEEGLRFSTQKAEDKRTGARLTLYNKKLYKIALTLDKRRWVTPPKTSPITFLAPIKLTWDAHKKEFRVPPIDLTVLKSRSKRLKSASRKSKEPPALAVPAPAPAPAPPNPLERLRTSLRETNDLAQQLGIELSLDQGRVRAILTFE